MNVERVCVDNGCADVGDEYLSGDAAVVAFVARSGGGDGMRVGRDPL